MFNHRPTFENLDAQCDDSRTQARVVPGSNRGAFTLMETMRGTSVRRIHEKCQSDCQIFRTYSVHSYRPIPLVTGVIKYIWERYTMELFMTIDV